MPELNLYPVIELSEFSTADVATAYEHAKGFANGFASAIRQVVRLIHAIPHHSSGDDLGCAYLHMGRSTLEGVSGRFRYHRENRGHHSGVIAFRTKGGYLADLERVGIYTLDKMEQINALCVANIDRSVGGPEPKRSDSACVYLTWGLGPQRSIRVPSAADLNLVARNVAQRSRGLVTAGEVLDGLSVMQNSFFYNILV